MKVLQELLLLEERKEGLVYTEKKTKGIVEKVIVVLEGNQSGGFTQVATRYKKLKLLIDKLNEQKDLLNPVLREKCVELFDAKDKILTRVVKTCSLTINVAKESDKPSTKTDYESVAAAYRELLIKDIEPNLVAELEAKLDEIVKQFTKITDSKEAALRVTLDKEPVSEGISDIWNKLVSFARKFATWIKGFDKSFDKIEAKMAKIKG